MIGAGTDTAALETAGTVVGGVFAIIIAVLFMLPLVITVGWIASLVVAAVWDAISNLTK